MNSLVELAHTLETGGNEILIDPAASRQARVSVKRMLDFAEQLKIKAIGAAIITPG